MTFDRYYWIEMVMKSVPLARNIQNATLLPSRLRCSAAGGGVRSSSNERANSLEPFTRLWLAKTSREL